MALKFKDPSTVLHVPGIGKVHSGNVTQEIISSLIAQNESHKALFVEGEPAPLFISAKAEKVKPSKTKSE
jgi:hypothetical protein